jgi:hypothetical protein
VSSTDAPPQEASSVDGTAVSTQSIASSRDATASSRDPAAASPDEGDDASTEAPSDAEAIVGPPDAALLLHRARVLFPSAKRFTVEGTVFVLVAMDSCPQFDAAARDVRRALRAYSLSVCRC